MADFSFQCALCLIYLLLHRHLKIAKLATTQTVTVAEFESMRASWENLFDAFQQRMETLAEVWRQQRMDVKIQMQCFAGGIFEEWYTKVRDVARSVGHERVDACCTG